MRILRNAQGDAVGFRGASAGIRTFRVAVMIVPMFVTLASTGNWRRFMIPGL
ncbi:MAG TPA: hypothetical protein VFP18_04090 [Candidatus Binatia bacterium]|nr:hypothetical protein [Candidatus Binatia bacterium]